MTAVAFGPGALLSAARDWIEAWNRRDLEAILDHYAEDVAFTSPTVVSRFGEPSGTLHGKAQLRAHFRRGLDTFGEAMRFRLIDVLAGVGGYSIYYAREDGATVVDTVLTDSSGRARVVHAHYHRPGDV